MVLVVVVRSVEVGCDGEGGIEPAVGVWTSVAESMSSSCSTGSHFVSSSLEGK